MKSEIVKLSETVTAFPEGLVKEVRERTTTETVRQFRLSARANSRGVVLEVADGTFGEKPAWSAMLSPEQAEWMAKRLTVAATEARKLADA